MKKLVLILTGMALTVGLLATAGFVYAQSVDDPLQVESQDDLPGGPGRFAGHSIPRGWFGDGVLSEYILPALADIFGFTDEQVDAFDIVKETFHAIRDEYSIEEVREKMHQAFSTAVDEAVSDGVITQEEADLMQERQQRMGDRQFPGDFKKFGGRGTRGNFPPMDRGTGVLNEYMDAALAEALGISLDEIQTMKDDGFNLREYAEEKGLSDEELAELMAEIHSNAVNAALADGVITEEQAEFMLSASNKFGNRIPFVPGPRGMHGDWNEGETD